MSLKEAVSAFAAWLQAEEAQLNAKLAPGAKERYSERAYDALQTERAEVQKINEQFKQLVINLPGRRPSSRGRSKKAVEQ